MCSAKRAMYVCMKGAQSLLGQDSGRKNRASNRNHTGDAVTSAEAFWVVSRKPEGGAAALAVFRFDL